MVRHSTGHIVLFVAAVLLASSAHAETKFKVLYSFKGGSDGAAPAATLLVVHQRFTYRTYLYGTPSEGGAYGYGTVFRLATYGSESVLYSFKGDFAGASDGASPYA